MRNLRSFPTLGLVLLAAAWPAIAQGQTLSFFKSLPESGPGVTIFDASGLYIFRSNGIRKFNLDGAELWSRQLPPSADPVHSVARTAAGIYVSRTTFAAGRLIPQLRLYDFQGNEIWSREVVSPTTRLQYPRVVSDASGVYVAADIASTPSNSSFLVRKYDDRGNELWTRQFEDSTFSLGVNLALDPTGLYVRTYLSFRKYTAAGTELWKRQAAANQLGSMEANATGVYLAGYNVGSPRSLGNSLTRYDSNGNEVWFRSGHAGQLALDANSVYVTQAASHEPGQCSSGSADAVVVRYDTEGEVVWKRQFGTYGYEQPGAITAGPSGVFVAGQSDAASFLARLETDSGVVTTSAPRILNECIVNAASFVGGAVSPGEIVAIFGSNLGPSSPVSATGDPRFETTLAETRVFFDGVPAPLLYVSSGQVNLVVPNSVGRKASVGIQVEYRGVLSQTVTLPVLAAHLGIFSLGKNQAAVINQDGTLNSLSNPAKRGSIVSIYATGGGLTGPETQDGAIVGDPPPRLVLPLKVDFWYLAVGLETEVAPGEVTYAGFVTGTVTGLLQVNVRLPEFIAGLAQAVLTIDGVSESPLSDSIYVAGN